MDDLTVAQQAMWSRGDFHRVGVAQQVVGELLAMSLHIHAGERVLDVAGGAGNAALAAARRGALVICTDYVSQLLEHALARAAVEGLPLETQVADAQDLPFDNASFDVVTSTFGAMFAPDQERTAAELMRVLRPGGRLGMANWTPDSWVGEHFGVSTRYAPSPAGVMPPTVWGTDDRLHELLGHHVSELTTTRRYVDITHSGTDAMFAVWAEWFGPIVTVLSRLDDEQRAGFRRDWIAVADRHNIATDGTVEIPSAYLEVVAVRR